MRKENMYEEAPDSEEKEKPSFQNEVLVLWRGRSYGKDMQKAFFDLKEASRR